LVFPLPVYTAEQNCNQRQHHGRKDAGFGADPASREPGRAAEAGVEEIVIRGESAVGNAVEKSLSPVPSRVESYSPPQIAGAAQEKAEKQSEKHHREQPELALPRIARMRQPEQQRQQNRRRPVTHSTGERELKIPTKRKLLRQAYHHKSRAPGRNRSDDCVAMNRDAGQPESVQRENAQQAGADRSKPNECAHPKILAEGESRRQAVDAKLAALHSCHDQSGTRSHEENSPFEAGCSQRRELEPAAQLNLPEQKSRRQLERHRHNQQESTHDHQKHQRSPARTNAVRSAEGVVDGRLRRVSFRRKDDTLVGHGFLVYWKTGPGPRPDLDLGLLGCGAPGFAQAGTAEGAVATWIPPCTHAPYQFIFIANWNCRGS